MFKSSLNTGGSGGTVTSVALAAPADLFTVSGSPIVGAGTLTLTKVNQSANMFYAGPSSGGPATPTFRLPVIGDISVAIGSQTSNKFLASPSVGTGQVSMRAITAADIASALSSSAVTSLSSSDASLTVSPSVGAVSAIINTAHTNIWTVQQDFDDGTYNVSALTGATALTANYNPSSFQANLAGAFGAAKFSGSHIGDVTIMDGTNCIAVNDSISNTINIGDGVNAAYFANVTVKHVVKIITASSSIECSDSSGEEAILCGVSPTTGGTGAGIFVGRFKVYDNAAGNNLNIDAPQRHLCNAAAGATLLDYSSTGVICQSSTGVLQAIFGDAGNSNYAISTDSSQNTYIEKLVSRYNGVATVASGIASIVAQANLTTQAAAIAATTIYAVPAAGAGQYRLSWVAKITRAASTSSVLGGTNGFQVKYTDQDDSVVVTSGALVNQNTLALSTNTTQTIYAGSIMVDCKASTNLQYLFDYTSVGVTTMQYNLHIRVERI